MANRGIRTYKNTTRRSDNHRIAEDIKRILGENISRKAVSKPMARKPSHSLSAPPIPNFLTSDKATIREPINPADKIVPRSAK